MKKLARLAVTVLQNRARIRLARERRALITEVSKVLVMHQHQASFRSADGNVDRWSLSVGQIDGWRRVNRRGVEASHAVVLPAGVVHVGAGLGRASVVSRGRGAECPLACSNYPRGWVSMTMVRRYCSVQVRISSDIASGSSCLGSRVREPGTKSGRPLDRYSCGAPPCHGNDPL